MNRRPSRSVLLTLGRLPVALELARGFSRAGWRVIVADPHYLNLCRMSAIVDATFKVPSPRGGLGPYLEALQELIGRERINLVVPVSEETVAVAALGERMAGNPPVFCRSQARVLELHDKLAFNRLASGFGLPVPMTRHAPEAADTAWPSGEIVVKPRFSASGRGLRFCPANEAVPTDGALVVQERLFGEELSGFAVARAGRPIASVVYRARVRSGSVAVCFERVDDAADVLAWMDSFIARSSHTGFIAFDFIRDTNGVPHAIECNPRATSGLHFLRVDAIAECIAADPENLSARPQDYREGNRFVESYSCFTAMLGATGDRRRRRAIGRELRAASDVCWSARDPLPFLLMTVNTWPVIWGALRSGRSFAEVAVEDIEWQGGHE